MVNLKSLNIFENITSDPWPGIVNEKLLPTPNYDIYRVSIHKNLEKLSFTEAVKYIVNFGIMAPTAHNKQPWKIKIDEENKQVQVTSDPESIGVPSDVEGRQTHVGLGCFATNLELAAIAYGLELNAKVMEGWTRKNGRKKTQGVKLVYDFPELNKAKLKFPEILKHLINRRVYRGPFQKGFSIPEKLLQHWEEKFFESQISTKFITQQHLKSLLAKSQFLADNVVLNIPKFRRELGHHMAPNNSTKYKVMPGNTFGLGDREALEVNLALESTGQFPGHFASGFPKADQEGIETCSAVVLIFTDENTSQAYFKAGKVLEKIWLSAQAWGYGVGVMAGMIESPLHNRTLQLTYGKGKYPAGVLRIGLPQKDTWPRSPREMLK